MPGSTLLLTPTEASKRLVSIDILRGFAVLGILVMNIQSYSMPGSAYLNPTSFESLESNHLWVWLMSHVFADQKFMSIFSMLFGASIIMISSKAKKEQLRSGNLQSRRFTGLLGLGILHAYLLWNGDVLVAYAICGFLMYYFRTKKTKVLFRTGIIFLAVGSAISLILGYSVPFWEPGQFEALRDRIWSPDSAAIMDEISTYRSNWERQMFMRAPSAFELQTQVFVSDTFWRVSGLMLIGMAFYKKRVFSTKQTKKYYRQMVVYGLGAGVPLVVAGVLLNFNSDWDFRQSFFYFSQLNYWGSVLMAIGYVGIVMIIVKAYTQSGMLKRLAQVGRMALSNYLMQSIVCTFIFYGHGFGLFADLDRSAQAFMVIVIWVFLIVFSAVWLRFFRYGPFEWLWRSFSYGKIQPISNSRY
ncbi:MAG: DUF418 domain-containing protein [Roseivirga sp.]|nr:DUF418 domain-containing protein [Roseivirga sp.]